MSTANRSRAGKVILVGALTAATLGGVGAAGIASIHAAAQPHQLSIQKIDERVAKSMVQLQILYSADVAYQAVDDTWHWSKTPVEQAYSCSGWFANSTGDIVTAGHCVERTGSREALIDAYLEQIKTDPATGVDDAWITENLEFAHRTFKLRASDGTSTPDQHITAFQSERLKGRTLETPVAASLIAARPFAKEDVALLHVDVADSIGLPIAPTSPGVGAKITVVGFPGSVTLAVNPATLTPGFQAGTISSKQTNENGVPKLQVDGKMNGGMSGGPTIDARGRVVGINSFGTIGEGDQFNFITDTDSMSAFLKDHNVARTATFDRWVDDRAVGTTALLYFAAGVLALMIGVTTALIVGLRGRSQRTPVQPAPAGRPGYVFQPSPVTVPNPTFQPIVPGTGQDGVPVNTEPVTVPASFQSNCDFGHSNMAGAAFCSTCGSSIGNPTPSGAVHA